MEEVKELNIKNRIYYHFDDIIDIKKFESNLLKVDKKSHRDFDIYYIGYNINDSYYVGYLLIVIVIVIVIVKIFVA